MTTSIQRKRIVIIAHFCDCPPENTNNRFNYIAEQLAKKHDVELITSGFSHRDKAVRSAPCGDLSYRITLINEPPYKKNISLKRLFISHKSMARALRRYLDKIDTPDIVYCATPSLDVAAVSAKFARRTNIPFYIDVQDLWPEAFSLSIKNPILSRVLLFPMKKKADFIYRCASRIFSVSDTYAKRVQAVSDAPSRTVYLGTDLDRFDSFAALHPSKIRDGGEVLLAYCGTVGASYDLERVVRSLALLKEGAPTLVILGDGPSLERILALAKRLDVKIKLCGKLPYPEMCGALKSCDIAINPIKRGAMQSIINKHADYAAAGLPVISTQRCAEYSQLLDAYGAGITVAQDDDEALANAIRELASDKETIEKMSLASRRLAHECFDRRSSYEKIFSCF